MNQSGWTQSGGKVQTLLADRSSFDASINEWPKPYIRLTMQGTKLVASNWIGVAYVVDLTTGNVDAGKSEGRPW